MVCTLSPRTDANDAWDQSLSMNEWVIGGESLLRVTLTKGYVENPPHANDTWDPMRPKRSTSMALSGLFGPAGWTDHSIVVLSRLFQTELLEGIDVRGQRLTRPFSEYGTQHVKAVLIRPTAFNTLAAAHLSNDPPSRDSPDSNGHHLATIACALERYALSQGHYPDKLEALKPQHIKKLPHDIINGNPLIYRRTSDGRFILYSTGPNEIDDGGVDRDTAEARSRKATPTGYALATGSGGIPSQPPNNNGGSFPQGVTPATSSLCEPFSDHRRGGLVAGLFRVGTAIFVAAITEKFRSGASHITTYHIVFEPLCISAFPSAQPRVKTTQPQAYSPPSGGVWSLARVSGFRSPPP